MRTHTYAATKRDSYKTSNRGSTHRLYLRSICRREEKIFAGALSRRWRFILFEGPLLRRRHTQGPVINPVIHRVTLGIRICHNGGGAICATTTRGSWTYNVGRERLHFFLLEQQKRERTVGCAREGKNANGNESLDLPRAT